MLRALPGEIAPKLALAATAELILQEWDSEDPQQWCHYAERFYRTVWRTDHGVVSAAFGLARQLTRNGNRADAVAVLDEVPATSRHFTTARLTSAVTLLSEDDSALDAVVQAIDAIGEAAALSIETHVREDAIRLCEGKVGLAAKGQNVVTVRLP